MPTAAYDSVIDMRLGSPMAAQAVAMRGSYSPPVLVYSFRGCDESPPHHARKHSLGSVLPDGISNSCRAAGHPYPSAVYSNHQDQGASARAQQVSLMQGAPPWTGCSGDTTPSSPKHRERAKAAEIPVEVEVPRNSASSAEQHDERVLGPDVELTIIYQGNSFRYKCASPLGKGSYGMVWKCEALNGSDGPVAVKEVMSEKSDVVQQAIFEAKLLAELGTKGLHQKLAAFKSDSSCGMAPLGLRVPALTAYEAHRLPGSPSTRVRVAMTSIPGSALDKFIEGSPSIEASGRLAAFGQGCLAARRMVQDLVPTFAVLNTTAYHRDMNSHNVMVVQSEKCTGNADQDLSFWLIDFGLAVRSDVWHDDRGMNQASSARHAGNWRNKEIGGDCRYWPTSSWMMYLFGWKYVALQEQYCRQYQFKLDLHGFGITAIELLCSIALSKPEIEADSRSPLVPGMRRVLAAWQDYWSNMSGWWSRLFGAFQKGEDVTALQSTFLRDRVVEKITALLKALRQALQDCASCAEDPDMRALLLTLAETINEGSTWGWMEIWRFCMSNAAASANGMPGGQQSGSNSRTGFSHRRSLTYDNQGMPSQSAQHAASSPSKRQAKRTSPRMVRAAELQQTVGDDSLRERERQHGAASASPAHQRVVSGTSLGSSPPAQHATPAGSPAMHQATARTGFGESPAMQPASARSAFPESPWKSNARSPSYSGYPRAALSSPFQATLSPATGSRMPSANLHNGAVGGPPWWNEIAQTTDEDPWPSPSPRRPVQQRPSFVPPVVHHTAAGQLLQSGKQGEDACKPGPPSPRRSAPQVPSFVPPIVHHTAVGQLSPYTSSPSILQPGGGHMRSRSWQDVWR